MRDSIISRDNFKQIDKKSQACGLVGPEPTRDGHERGEGDGGRVGVPLGRGAPALGRERVLSATGNQSRKSRSPPQIGGTPKRNSQVSLLDSSRSVTLGGCMGGRGVGGGGSHAAAAGLRWWRGWR